MTSSKFLTGVLLGIGIGFLLAPDNGSETRKKVIKKVKDACDAVQDTINEIKDQVSSVAHESVEELESMNNSLHEATNE